MTEAQLQNYLMKQAKAHQVYARKLVAVGRTGFPDVMICFDGLPVFIELKSPTGTGRLSKKQNREIVNMRERGMTIMVLHTTQEIDNVIRAITHGDAPRHD